MISLGCDMTGKSKLYINKPDDAYTKFPRMVIDGNFSAVNVYPSDLPYTFNWQSSYGNTLTFRFVLSSTSTVYDCNVGVNAILECE